MALDTRGLASGFAQGFGLMNNYQNQQKQNERAERGLQMREESFQMQKDQYDQAQKKETATMIYGKIINDIPLANEERTFLEENPIYQVPLNPAIDQTIGIAERVVDPEDPLDFNSEEALYSINAGFEPLINRGSGGKKRIAAGLPGAKPGTMSFDLDVEREDGTRDRQPLTANRGTVDDGDDEVRQVPVENLVNTVQGIRMIRNGFAGAPGGKERAAKMYALLTGKTPERAKGIQINDRLVNPHTGEVMADFSGQEQGDADWRRLNDGRLYNQRTGEIRDVGGAEEDGAPANDGTGGLSSSVLSQIQQTTRNFHGSFNPDGSFLGIPAGAREKYTLAMERAQELVGRGMPVFEATNLANLSVADPLTEDEASRLAQQEAEQEVQGWFKGDERDQYVERRTRELLEESKGAQRRYEQIAGGSTERQGGNPPAQVDMNQANQIKADYRSGKITREEAAAKLRSIGFQ